MRFSDVRHTPAQTLACELRDYPEWHRGRPRYGVWTVPVECPQVLARLRLARQHLGDWLHADYRRQAHVTLFVCGFPSQLAQFDDDFPGERLAAQLEALRKLRSQPFELHIGGVDSFASAPFLTVTDTSGQLDAMRRILAMHSPEIRQSPYHPHLTVGLYARALLRAELEQCLASFETDEPLPLRVDELHYSTYIATELCGPLTTEQRLTLG